MAQAINLKEHNAAFTKFLIFFLVTVAMVTGALYFDFSTPKRELEILRERSDLLRDQNLAQENYKRTLMETIAVIDRLDSSTSKAIVSSELEPKIAILKNAAKVDDSTSAKNLNEIVTNLVIKYKNARFDFEDSKGFQEELRKKELQIVELKDALDRAKRNEMR
jgi:hypothetical protein